MLGHRSIGVFHTPLGDDVPKGALTPGKGKLIEEMSEGLLAGILAPEEGLKTGKNVPAYVLVVDKRTASDKDTQPAARTARVTFGRLVKAVEVLQRDRSGRKRIVGKTVSLKLKGGDGRLLRITPSGPTAAQ